MALCCGKKSTAVTASGHKAEDSVMKSEEAVGGCYLTYDDNELYYTWKLSPPEGTVILYAKPDKPIAPGKLNTPAKHLMTVTSDETFFKGISLWIQEVAPLLPRIQIDERADSYARVPFILASHQPGNGVIGDRAVEVKPGSQWLFVDGSDAVSVVPKGATCYQTRSQTQDEFVKNAKEAGGCAIKLDPSGRMPPSVVYS